MSKLKTGRNFRKTIGEHRFKRTISGYRMKICKKHSHVGDLPKTKRKNKRFIRIFRPDKNNVYSLFILTILPLDVFFSLNSTGVKYFSPFDNARVLSFPLDKVSG